jgi:serine/threonine protein phosphatase PrpC
VNSTAILQWAAFTHSGSRKPRNDDSVIAFASGPDGAEPLPQTGNCTLNHQDLVFAISDGMGGGNSGDIASSTLLQQMAEIIPQTFKAAAAGLFPDSLAHLTSAINSIHQRINETAAQSPEHSGMAATLALAWFTPENLYLANIGDSRIYLSRNGALTQLSRDHSIAWCQWKRGEISEPEYRAHPRRAALYEIVGGGHRYVRPYLAAIPIFPGDRLLICSDGLIDGLWERNISTGLSSPGAPPPEIATSLLKRAIDNSGIDDTSLIVITVSASPEASS